MSTVVLARKYRPPNFDALVGQEHVVQALSNALTRQRLHHAYLFTGTRGVGKTTVSRILAKSLNCTGADGSGGITAQPCGVCDACRDIDTGRFIDYVELDAASNRGVDEISQLLDQAVYKPVLGRFKVYMIDEVHMLSTTAFNAMLKTLEEPPDYLKFVLATTDPQKVPPTVLSRCLQFNLRPMAPQTVQEHLAVVLAQEQIAADAGALRLIARAARGSMRDALSLTDQAIAFGAGALSEDGVRQMLGAVDRGHAVRIVEALAAGDGAALVGAADALRGLGLSAAGTLEEIAMLLQQMAVLHAVPDAADAADPDAIETARLATRLAADETQLFYSIALQGRAELGLAPDEYSGLVMVLLRMLAFKPGSEAAAPPVRAASASASAPLRAAVVSTTVAAKAPGPSPGAPRAAVAVARLAAPAIAAPAAASSPAETEFATDSTTGFKTEFTTESATDLATGSTTGSATAIVSAAARAATRPGRVDTAAPASALRAAVAAPPGPAAARPASPMPASRHAVSDGEPPPWLDAPFEGEVIELAVASAPTTATARTDAPAAATFTPTALGARWDELVQALNAAGSVSAFARELAMQSECLQLDERAAPVVCRLRVERETLRAPAPREKLQAALAEALQREVRLEVEPGAASDSPARRETAERARRQAEAEQIIHGDPLVQALMAQYKTARVVPGSVKPH